MGNRSKVSYESGFVLSSTAQQREVVTEVTDDPMLQQIQIITGYIAQARQQNRFDEVHMLETNLNMLNKNSIGKENFSKPRHLSRIPHKSQRATFPFKMVMIGQIRTRLKVMILM